jgi:hypothetical protein
MPAAIRNDSASNKTACNNNIVAHNGHVYGQHDPAHNLGDNNSSINNNSTANHWFNTAKFDFHCHAQHRNIRRPVLGQARHDIRSAIDGTFKHAAGADVCVHLRVEMGV